MNLTDWRGATITVGAQVLYHSRNDYHAWKLGHVTQISDGTMTIQWSEEQWENYHKPSIGRKVSPERVTVIAQLPPIAS